MTESSLLELLVFDCKSMHFMRSPDIVLEKYYGNMILQEKKIQVYDSRWDFVAKS